MAQPPDHQVTRLLRAIQEGKGDAEDRLVDFVYEDLRHLARRLMSRERRGHTLRPTALVHDAYLRLRGYLPRLEDGRHLTNAMRLAMRRILVDWARARGGGERTTVFEIPDDRSAMALADLARVLEELGEIAPREREVVEYRFLFGLTVEETARQLGVSRSTVEKDWTLARGFLYRRLRKSG